MLESSYRGDRGFKYARRTSINVPKAAMMEQVYNVSKSNVHRERQDKLSFRRRPNENKTNCHP